MISLVDFCFALLPLVVLLVFCACLRLCFHVQRFLLFLQGLEGLGSIARLHLLFVFVV